MPVGISAKISRPPKLLVESRRSKVAEVTRTREQAPDVVFRRSTSYIGKQNQEITLPLATNLKSLVTGLSGCELSEIFGREGNWLNGEFPRE